MNCERNIRFELLARLCPNTTGADIRSVCIEAGMFAIRSRRKTVTEKDMIDAVNKCAHPSRRARRRLSISAASAPTLRVVRAG